MKKTVLLLSIVFIFCCSALALSIPEKPSSYVNDYAGLLSESVKSDLTSTLSNFEKETSNQIVIAIFKSLEGSSLEDFSIKLAEKWKVGKKGKDNGVILLIFKEDKKIRIEVGYGLEGVLTDAISSQIIRNEIVPNFKSGNYDAGIVSAVNAIIKTTKGEYKADNKKNLGSSDSQNLLVLVLILFFFIPIFAYIALMFVCISYLGFPVGLIIALVLILILEFIRRIFFGSIFGQTFHGGRGGWYDGGSFGGGGFSSGGFGGFSSGGGSFGGGGSSGSW